MGCFGSVISPDSQGARLRIQKKKMGKNFIKLNLTRLCLHQKQTNTDGVMTGDLSALAGKTEGIMAGKGGSLESPLMSGTSVALHVIFRNKCCQS